MKVDKKFAPITITIEYEEELDFFYDLIRKARELQVQRRGWLSRKSDDSFIQKCNYLEGKL